MQGSSAAVERSAKPHPIDVQVGLRIRLRRIALGLSQKSLGKSVGVTFQQLQKYERGVNRVSASNLFVLAQTLNVPIGYFFGAGPTASGAADEADTATQSNAAGRESALLLQLFQRIPEPKLRHHIIRLVRGVVEIYFSAQSKMPARQVGAKPTAAGRSRADH